MIGEVVGDVIGVRRGGGGDVLEEEFGIRKGVVWNRKVGG